MKLIKPSFEILTPIDWREWGIKKFIELVGRTCYKSEDKITDDSYKGFVQRMIDSKHYAMLEHGTVYLEYHVKDPSVVGNEEYQRQLNEFSKLVDKYATNPYSVVKVNHYYDTCFITTNYRVLVENHWLNDLKFITEPTVFHVKRVTVKFISSIHFYKDITRHRVMSFAIESTRFCNYSKNKFGSNIAFTKPIWLKNEDETEFIKDCETIESIYFKYLNKGYKAQNAAYFLSQGVKGDAIVTGFVNDDGWKHLFDLRALGKTGEPLPQVKELAKPLYEEFIKLGYIHKED